MVPFKRISPKLLLLLIVLLTALACKDSPERHLQLGAWYLQKDLLDEAILEFREVPRLFPNDHRTLSREEFQILSKAHYNLALVYTRKKWWEYALKEAEICFDLQPTKDHRNLIQLIKQRLDLEYEDAGS